jgi:DMSO reductase family type II enzyme chaperone
MFVYSLAGLELDNDASLDVEVEDSPITARLGVYQQLARLFAYPDADVYAAALKGEWPDRLSQDAALLPFEFEYGDAWIPEGMSQAEFEAEYLRLFEVGAGTDGPGAPLYGGAYVNGDRIRTMEEVVRFYEYFGLHTSAEDPRPPDHLATELEFMKFLTFKEAASASPRLQASFRRAQHDFLDRQLSRWVPKLAEKVTAEKPDKFWDWAISRAAGFVAADAQYVSGLVG